MTHIIDNFGNEYWFNEEGYFYRTDGPAFIGFTGSEEWYKDGHLYRNNNPDIIHISGKEEWFENGNEIT